MLLREIIAGIPEIELRGDILASIRGISYDSRTVEPGDLFVAMRGVKTDGARHVQQATERGAAAIASEQPVVPDSPVAFLKVPDARRFLAQASHVFFEDPTSQLKLVGITGTNGKTTTSYLVESVFRQAGLKSCLLGTIGMKIDDTPYPSKHTTPEAPDLLRFLRQAVNEGVSHGVLEVSSHALALNRVYGCKITIGVFSNLTPDHLDFHHDMESYYQAKKLLFVEEGNNRLETAVINADDPYGVRLAQEAACPVLRYGFGPQAGVRAIETSSHTDRTKLRVATPRGELHITSHLLGRPNTYNILAATGAALGLGLDPNVIQDGIEALRAVAGRMELIDCGQPFTVLVDYAHTEDALKKILETIAQLSHKKIITVFGCGGDRDRTKRPAMGFIAGNLSDLVIATSDNPRTEDPRQILAEIEDGLTKGKALYTLIVDRRAAIREALSLAAEGDVVLIAGKGHEQYQVLGAKVIPFDDRAVAREILQQLAADGGQRN